MINKILNNIAKSRQLQLEEIHKHEDQQFDKLFSNDKLREIYSNLLEYSLSEDFSKKKYKEMQKEYEDELKKNDIKPLETTVYICKKCFDSCVLNGAICKCVSNEEFKNTACKLCFDNFGEYNQFKKNKIDYSTTLNKYYKEMEKVAKGKHNKKILILSGPPGVGKTYLTFALIDLATSNFKTCKFIKSYDLSEKFTASAFDDEKILPTDDIYTADILIVDDLGSEKILNNITNEMYIQLLDTRLQNGRTTLFTTNLSYDSAKRRFNERFVSRLFDVNNSITLSKEFFALDENGQLIPRDFRMIIKK